MARSTTSFKTCGTADNVRTQFNALRDDVGNINTTLDALDVDRGANKTQIDALVTDLTATRAELVKVRDDLELMLNGTFMRSAPGVTIGTSSKAAVKVVDCVAQFAGLPVAVASAETAFTATTHDIADGSANSYILSVDSDGTTFTLTMGTEAVGATPGALGSLPAGDCPVGLITIAASGAIFNASTDELDAAHLTVTYTDYGFASNLTGSTEITSADPAAITATAADAATSTGAPTLTSKDLTEY